MVHHHGPWRHDDASAGCAQGEAEVGVLVVGRPKADVEATHLLEGGAAHEEGCGRAVVDVPDMTPLRAVRVRSVPEIDTAAVAGDDRAALLHETARVDEPAAGGGDTREGDGADQGIEPTRLRLGVVVQ